MEKKRGKKLVLVEVVGTCLKHEYRTAFNTYNVRAQDKSEGL